MVRIAYACIRQADLPGSALNLAEDLTVKLELVTASAKPVAAREPRGGADGQLKAEIETTSERRLALAREPCFDRSLTVG